jgi:hypothetical protein
MDKIKAKCWKKLKVCKEQTTKAKKSYLCVSVYQINTYFGLKTEENENRRNRTIEGQRERREP